MLFLIQKKKIRLIFDGYPRSLSQAKNLDLLLEKSIKKLILFFFLMLIKKQ